MCGSNKVNVHVNKLIDVCTSMSFPLLVQFNEWSQTYNQQLMRATSKNNVVHTARVSRQYYVRCIAAIRSTWVYYTHVKLSRVCANRLPFSNNAWSLSKPARNWNSKVYRGVVNLYSRVRVRTWNRIKTNWIRNTTPQNTRGACTSFLAPLLFGLTWFPALPSVPNKRRLFPEKDFESEI